MPMLASFTVDVEPDCPPYLDSCRGMVEGMPRLLDLLAEIGVRATFFTTGQMARRFPEVVHTLVRAGHELGCHGDQHRDFTTLTEREANDELRVSLATLREFDSVRSFRAPYLRFPPPYLPLLVAHGLTIDSSAARYKLGAAHRLAGFAPGLTRIAASVTSSALRLPGFLRRFTFALGRGPLVLFVHPWEAADFRRSTLRWDCRFRTGLAAVACWRNAICGLRGKGAEFLMLREVADRCARLEGERRRQGSAPMVTNATDPAQGAADGR